MKITQSLLLAASAALAVPTLSAAQEIEVSGGVELTYGADLTGSGLGAASTGYEGGVEIAQGGFTSGLGIESIDEATDDFELSLFTGYAVEAGAGTYGLTVTGYFWNNTGFQNYELTLGAEYSVSDNATVYGELTYNVTDAETSAILGTELSLGEAITVGLEAEYAFEAATTDLTLTGEWAFNDTWAIGTEVGRSETDGNIYGEIGVTYALAGGASVGLLYEDADDSDGTVSLVLGYEF